jgi:hypothetical protein
MFHERMEFKESHGMYRVSDPLANHSWQTTLTNKNS